jgi:succinylarginine dihydrolase
MTNSRELWTEKGRVDEYNKAFRLIESLLNGNEESISWRMKMTMIILNKKTTNQKFELSPFTLDSIIRNVEKYYRDDLTRV